jgi:hypothetical protein
MHPALSLMRRGGSGALTGRNSRDNDTTGTSDDVAAAAKCALSLALGHGLPPDPYPATSDFPLRGRSTISVALPVRWVATTAIFEDNLMTETQ